MSPAARIAIAVALGGFLMGFDASVISGVVGFIETEYALDAFELGWVVASLTLTAAVAMLAAGPLSDRYGRLPVLRIAAVLFALSAVFSAFAPDYLTLVLARMLGGFGVGAALIIAPVYIAEIAPASDRGRLVSFNQLNIVVGISAAFFSNYLLLQWAGSGGEWAATLRVDTHTWRWMLGVEALPAILYLFALSRLPESPRWLLMRARDADAVATLERAGFGAAARSEADRIRASLAQDADTAAVPFLDLLSPTVRTIMVVALIVALVQQVTGINAVFFYAPMIFEQSGIGTDAAFLQAVLVGVVNLVFTIVAMLVIDRLGRRPLLLTGLAGIAACMMLLSGAFADARYTLTPGADVPDAVATAVADMESVTFESDLDFREALAERLTPELLSAHEAALLQAAVSIDATRVLIGILGFVACFAFSLGPVMWVLLSELFPNRLRGVAISVVGLVNSAASFLVQLVFPVELAVLGNAMTFAVYGGFALLGLVLLWRLLPETKGQTLEALEAGLTER